MYNFREWDELKKKGEGEMIGLYLDRCVYRVDVINIIQEWSKCVVIRLISRSRMSLF